MTNLKTLLIIAALVVILYSISNEKIKLKMNGKKTNQAKTWDKVSDKRINTLYPTLRHEVASLINEAQKRLGVKYRVTEALRTIPEQNDLYAQGRTKQGKIVTNARGGQSYHNFGLGFDIVPIVNGKAIWNNNKGLYTKFAKLAEKRGWAWGGNWTNKDLPHFEKTFGIHHSQYFSDVSNSQTIYPTILA